MIRRVGSFLLLIGLQLPADAEPSAGQIERGHQVYVAEGCINCHSQYVRPVAADAERWGPTRPLAEALDQAPPQLGNRRQGPDLQNVANRRPREWQRLHLIAPRAVTPGSRMPAYASLFAGDASRGEALLDYLDSLGAATMTTRWTAAQAWTPHESGAGLDADAGRRHFLAFCAGCHGAEGRGDGRLAPQLPVPPRDLVTGAWVYQPTDADPAVARVALARLIKFGVPGSTMAGHEYLSDGDVLALTDYVRNLRRAGNVPPASL
jgi:cytochrome c oxidase cbb3-type subunit 2